ncbi:MAG: glycosyltransferase [Victivallales bacterium]|nr:glycosyltransferase [Victivallales bacterium]
MKALVTVASIQNESAGPSYTVPSLCRGLAKNGVDVQLHVLDSVPTCEREYSVINYERRRFPVMALGRSPEMLQGLKDAVTDGDIVHNNGIWMMPNVYPAIAKRGTKCKLVFCPRGGLAETALKRSRIKKFLMGHFGGQYMALRETDMFHAASMKELLEIRALGYKQPIALVPNGIDLPDVAHKSFGETKRKIAFLGRIHTTKAVDHLVKAWGNVAGKFPEWSLEIAGPDCGAVSTLKTIIAEKDIPRVSIVGELHGMDKYTFLASVDLFVIPSLTENFGITIAEALACGTPVIASRGCPWERLEEKGCGWWIDIGVDALTAQLENALDHSPVELERMGIVGKRWMAAEFSWDEIAKKMIESYKWLCMGGIKPDFVQLV